MASEAIAAFGTFLQTGDASNADPLLENYTTIDEVMSISGPTLSAATVEVTNHSSGVPWREFISTLLDAGEVSFDLNFVPSNATHSATSGVVADMTGRVRRSFRIIFPDSGSTEWYFQGVYTKFESSEPTDGKISASVTIKLSGEPTLA